MAKIKHGRQALDRLLDGLKILDDLAEEISESLLPPNIRLIEDDIRELRTEILSLRQFIAHKLDPMLQRRDAQTTEEQSAQFASLAADMADLRDRLAILERSHVPDRARKGGDAERGSS